MKAAVIPSKGIGDALLMMIASHRLMNEGFEVVTYHPALKELQNWFPGQYFSSFSLQELSSCDLVIVQNDNSPLMRSLKATLSSNQLSLFYPTYFPHRHPPLSCLDRIFDSQKTMVTNIAEAVASLLQKDSLMKDNGLTPPSGLMHRLHPKRVVIHPSSSSRNKNWKRAGFLNLNKKLKAKDFDPVFALNPLEREAWQTENILCPLFLNLDQLARTVYESGYIIGNDSLIGHLASCLNIPTLIIANDARRMRLWRPGWKEGEVVTPSPWIPNIKFLRLRERCWSSFISTRQVFSTFVKLAVSQKQSFHL